MIQNLITLTRLNKPIGIFLLLWPTLCALWVAARGVPALSVLTVFVLGVVCMRSAGCVINDIADRHFDKHVARTRMRPLATGKVSLRAAYYIFVLLCVIALSLVLTTNLKTVALSFVALPLAMLYPLTKRMTHLPQAFLGIAFAMAIPMAFTAAQVTLSFEAVLLFLSTIAWAIAYDTQYALMDKSDDLKIGVKSSAILFGKQVYVWIGFFQSLVLLGFFWLGIIIIAGAAYWCGLLGAALLFVYQHHKMKSRTPEAFFAAFLNNQWVGMSLFLGIALDFAMRG